MENVFAAGLGPLEKAAEMLGHHTEGILNYIFYRITNAASAGISSTIQNLKHAARGLPAFKTSRNRDPYDRKNCRWENLAGARRGKNHCS